MRLYKALKEAILLIGPILVLPLSLAIKNFGKANCVGSPYNSIIIERFDGK